MAAYDDETRTELLDLVGDEAERLDRIVANLLSLSRVEAGALKPDRQAVAVDELIAERVRRLSLGVAHFARECVFEPFRPPANPFRWAAGAWTSHRRSSGSWLSWPATPAGS